jgi:hypothetical protein
MIDTEEARRARAEHRRATWTIKRHTSFESMKADEYAYWQSVPTHVRMAAISELTTEQYAMKGIVVGRMQRTVFRKGRLVPPKLQDE